MAIGRPKAIDGAPRQGSTAKEELSCSARNDGAPTPCDLSHGVGVRQGKKVMTALLRHRRSRRQPSFGQISPLERPLRCARSGCDHMENVVTHRNRWNPAMLFSARAPRHERQAYRIPGTAPAHDPPPTPLPGCRDRRSLDSGIARIGCSVPRMPQPAAAPSPSSTMMKMAPSCPGPPRSYRQSAQAVAIPCPEASGVANAVTRTNAVMPTAAAPMMEKTSCQVSDGMV